PRSRRRRMPVLVEVDRVGSQHLLQRRGVLLVDGLDEAVRQVEQRTRGGRGLGPCPSRGLLSHRDRACHDKRDRHRGDGNLLHGSPFIFTGCRLILLTPADGAPVDLAKVLNTGGVTVRTLATLAALAGLAAAGAFAQTPLSTETREHTSTIV